MQMVNKCLLLYHATRYTDTAVCLSTVPTLAPTKPAAKLPIQRSLLSFLQPEDKRSPCPEDAERRPLAQWEKDRVTTDTDIHRRTFSALYLRIFGQKPATRKINYICSGEGVIALYSLAEVRWIGVVHAELTRRRQHYELAHPSQPKPKSRAQLQREQERLDRLVAQYAD